MKVSHSDEAGFTYTTPVFCGNKAAIQWAVCCIHHYLTMPQIDKIADGYHVEFQHCEHCCASRARFRRINEKGQR